MGAHFLHLDWTWDILGNKQISFKLVSTVVFFRSTVNGSNMAIFYFKLTCESKPSSYDEAIRMRLQTFCSSLIIPLFYLFPVHLLGKASGKRSSILKSIFKLMDRSSPKVLLSLARLTLAVSAGACQIQNATGKHYKSKIFLSFLVRNCCFPVDLFSSSK